MANTVGNKHDAAIARVWDFPLPLARCLALPLSREGVGIRLKNWTEAGNFWAVAEDYGSKFAGAHLPTHPERFLYRVSGD
jgi:hypothetical protein